MSDDDAVVQDFYHAASRLYQSQARLRLYLDGLFRNVPLEGRRMLDVGGGNGMLSFYAAVQGASSVVCLEPAAAGSNPAISHEYETFESGIRSSQVVQLRNCTLQDFSGDNRSFDVLVIHNAINHLDEDACARLHKDVEAQHRYVQLFRKLFTLAAPSAHIVVSDCARNNLFGLLGLRNPFAPDIDWRIHQQPRLWVRLLQQVGFTGPRIRWNMPTRLGRAGQAVAGNWIGAFVTTSHFTIVVRRPS